MHGGTNPGAPRGKCNAWKHGVHSGETKAAARYLSEVTTNFRGFASWRHKPERSS